MDASKAQRDLEQRTQQVAYLSKEVKKWKAQAAEARKAAALSGTDSLPGSPSNHRMKESSLMPQAPMRNPSAENLAGTKSPWGTLSLVFTDVMSSTQLWDHHQDWMAQCQVLHDDYIRELILQHSGYEVKTVGDSFMVAFQNAVDAARFASALQEGLLRVKWPPLRGCGPRCPCVSAGPMSVRALTNVAMTKDALLWNGLRVRVGVHTGDPIALPDPNTGRMDYFGPMVNFAARVEGVAQGGFIAISEPTWKTLQDEGQLADLNFVEHVLESVSMKGIAKPHKIHVCVPKGLEERLAELPELTNKVKAATAAAEEGGTKSPDAEDDLLDLSLGGISAPSGWCVAVSARIPYWEELQKDKQLQPCLDHALQMYLGVLHDHLTPLRGVPHKIIISGFIAVFQSPLAAAQWALEVQEALLEVPWPPPLLRHKRCRLADYHGKIVFRGLCPTITLLACQLKPLEDAISTPKNGPTYVPSHSQEAPVFYNDPALDLCYEFARLGFPGEILICQRTTRSLKEDLKTLGQPSFKVKGTFQVQQEKQLIHSMMPASLATRRLLPPYRQPFNTKNALLLPFTMSGLPHVLNQSQLHHATSTFHKRIYMLRKQKPNRQVTQVMVQTECAMMRLHDTYIGDADGANLADEPSLRLTAADWIYAVYLTEPTSTPGSMRSNATLRPTLMQSLSSRNVHDPGNGQLIQAHGAVRHFMELLKHEIIRPLDQGQSAMNEDDFMKKWCDLATGALGLPSPGSKRKAREFFIESVNGIADTPEKELFLHDNADKLRLSLLGLLSRTFLNLKPVLAKFGYHLSVRPKPSESSGSPVEPPGRRSKSPRGPGSAGKAPGSAGKPVRLPTLSS
eukprot:NODE_117_length_2741_cov_20.323923_g93_i0.p1 GENE.NODE_117_length_2741_cov_20.323923_g93_i0~~NODE_117_length_2741_cov_20.323923_g93_i0.p1  ORF type:complete len:895 (+),score=243.84 NODE_117_length_2741_cov_20.323923_g93_i0:134-2686(+)